MVLTLLSTRLVLWVPWSRLAHQSERRERFIMLVAITCTHCKQNLGTLQYSNYYECPSPGCGAQVCKSCRSAGLLACPTCKATLKFHDGDAAARWAAKNGIMA